MVCGERPNLPGHAPHSEGPRTLEARAIRGLHRGTEETDSPSVCLPAGVTEDHRCVTKHLLVSVPPEGAPKEPRCRAAQRSSDTRPPDRRCEEYKSTGKVSINAFGSATGVSVSAVLRCWSFISEGRS